MLLNIDITKYKSSTSAIAVPSIIDGTQFLHDTCIAGAAVTVIWPLTNI